MGLLSFLKRKSGDSAARPVAIPESADSVQQARTRARQRLVGASVLVAAGVIGFPLLFETQPRPLPGDTPIDIVRREGATSTATPARTAPAARVQAPPPAPINEPVPDAGRAAASASPASAAAPEPQVAAVAAPPEPKPEARPDTKPAPKPEARPPADSSRAQALLDGKPASAKPVSAADGRYIVQVGAFAEVNAAREARQKVEKLGLKTYTQVVEVSGGKRIRVRVGPFASREEADRAAAKLKSAGLASAVYTL